jgi:O-antigen/teichoic acid export membrane protein
MSAKTLRSRLPTRAVGAVAAQLSQALASFALQFAAARTLGVVGLGKFAILYGGIVLGTAVCTGIVGDSLTVLDRSSDRVRAGLQNWCLILASSAGLIAALLAWIAGILTPTGAVTFGAATLVFIVEDAMRRTLMSVMRFWSLLVVDLTSLVVSLLVLGGLSLGGVHFTVGLFMFALLIGQIAACFSAAVCLPRSERRLASPFSAAMREVIAFGAWRGAQQAIRPAMLTAVRILITVVAGSVAYGRLEAARVYMAPALLLVSGMGSFLLPMYVSRKTERPDRILRRADVAACGLFAGSLALGAVATAAVPLVGDLITGGSYHISPLAVFAWAVYAASTAAIMPYGTLAAVLGKQAAVMGLRLIDPVVSLLLCWSVLLIASAAVSWTPFAVASGSFLSGYAIRQRVLVLPIRRARQAASDNQFIASDTAAIPVTTANS